MTERISIVIPAYNMEKYIEECLNSILNQTFQDWECIIVNDGSTDNTLAIIENFVAKDKRFSCYTIPNSGSAKIPRDMAVSYAKADWVIGIDADDFIDKDVLEKLYARAMETKADIVYLRMKLFDEENPKNFSYIPVQNFDMKKVLTGKEAVMLTIPKWVIGGNGIVKKELWTACSTFNSGVKHINVDEYDTREMLIKAKIVAFEDVIYHYRQHSSSITKKISAKFFETLITDKMLETLFSESFGHDSYHRQFVSQYRMEEIIVRRVFLFRIGSKLQADERKKIKGMIKEHYMTIDKRKIFENNIFKRVFYTYSYFLFEITSFCRYIFGASLRFFRHFLLY
ncbi:MAG: glycosyltransferase [Fibromonadaceae bacterium]|jgi:glycosyltransferase involved in cell wall biosynthesis|nr:glycosyltransferase [Fibromonadaceae bacterium]